ncbi:hypothetical protein GGI07_004207 [Coemansia sp. Benny D115]|nr:hypothetical protein GGI07_004207 [Coemansia sp. Benny D115]
MTNITKPAVVAEDPATLLSSIPFFDTLVSHDSLFEDSLKLLSRVFPTWSADDLKLKQCKDGITNKLIQCTNTREDVTVLIRAYGKSTEVFIDRDQELIPHARFSNGLVYGFIPGTVAKPEDMGSSQWAPLIAKKLAEWGQVDLPGDHSPHLFSTLRRWIADIPPNYANPKDNETFHGYFTHTGLLDEINDLESMLVKLNSPIVFSHNDLLSGNIIMSESQDEVFFIDYEYATYNYRGFDIANHFNEYAGFECDYSRYPKKENQLAWFKVYLDQLSMDSSPEELEKMYREVSFFQLGSHAYWGIWGLVQAHVSDIDFPYMDYAKMRFEQYYKIKKQLLA